MKKLIILLMIVIGMSVQAEEILKKIWYNSSEKSVKE